jgi:hypothetical protein
VAAQLEAGGAAVIGGVPRLEVLHVELAAGSGERAEALRCAAVSGVRYAELDGIGSGGVVGPRTPTPPRSTRTRHGSSACWPPARTTPAFTDPANGCDYATGALFTASVRSPPFVMSGEWSSRIDVDMIRDVDAVHDVTSIRVIEESGFVKPQPIDVTLPVTPPGSPRTPASRSPTAPSSSAAPSASS